jgi:hypothetical protein
VVYDPFSASAVAHFTACFDAALVIAQACATSPDAPCTMATTVAPAAPAAPNAPVVPATPNAPTAPIVVGVLCMSCGTFLPLRGNADGPAHAATAMTLNLLLVGDADGPAPAVTAMTYMGAYILMASKGGFERVW